jgi:hypothetical protein
MPKTIDTKFKFEPDGHVFTECPRWCDGRLYFSDINGILNPDKIFQAGT